MFELIEIFGLFTLPVLSLDFFVQHPQWMLTLLTLALDYLLLSDNPKEGGKQ